MIKLIILLFLLFGFSILYGCHIEDFQGTLNILTSQRLNLENVMNGNLISLPNKGWDYVIFKLLNRQRLELYNNPDAIVVDSKDFAAYGKKFTSTILPKGYFCVFTSPNKKNNFKCGYEWEGKKIGYFDRIEKNLIDAVVYGYRTYSKYIELSLKDLDNLEAVFDKVDLIVIYVIPNSPMAKILATHYLYLLESKNIDTDRIRITYPDITLENVSIDDVFGSNNKISSTTKIPLLLSTQLIQVNLKNPSKMETFITRIQFSKEFNDTSYKCLGDDSITSKLACESPYDRFGEPKSRPTIFDKQCTSDTECPYFKANQNYPNTRGKCLKDGTCEMPIGILRIGYTKAYDMEPYQPFCYQCKNPKDKSCCEDQDRMVKLKNSNLKSADYAFPNDTEERTNYNLPTTILI